MKQVFSICILFSFILLSQSCDDEKKAKNEVVVIENLKLTEEDEKWEANPETTEGINEMLALLNEFEETEKLKDYKKLGRQLTKLNKKILNKCSMKGEAHDNLHAFLMPVFRHLKTLKKTKSIPEAKKTVFNFERHLNQYGNYFE